MPAEERMHSEEKHFTWPKSVHGARYALNNYNMHAFNIKLK